MIAEGKKDLELPTVHLEAPIGVYLFSTSSVAFAAILIDHAIPGNPIRNSVFW
jgi:hypothetical protein